MSHTTRSAARPDRRGRGLRGVLLPELPRYQTRSQRFDAAVLDVYENILADFEDALGGLDIAVDTVPRMQMEPGFTQWPEDIVADGQVPLGRLIPAGVDDAGNPTRPRLIVFRRPIELRTEGAASVRELLRFVIVQLVAVYLNVSPERVDPGFSLD
ncbi:metallopeptidase family protein [Corynebacterium heidelbergense]|uniref:Exonuclease n=1 Tax=Corynebacterium heidelbergense TaxID=2055947 RepID=A0A364V9I0_9CORY|nr:metallopeptidase family protein [Corynebacterium heidelbergense]RAV31414.1 hypothetical protein DLJ54_08485 [Corynebacterium heidelbergense]RAV33295.1 hypothetical protein CWC39_09255 [Corynebacterium heidelbergense]